MKTSPFKITSTIGILLFATICSVLFLSCGDDEPAEFITAKTSTFTFDELNTCDIGGTVSATSFDFIIEYEASENIKIKKILFDLEWSNGDTESTQTDDFTNAGTRIEYDWCYRFGGDAWVEITHRLETENGLTSNNSVIKINRPAGAN